MSGGFWIIRNIHGLGRWVEEPQMLFEAKPKKQRQKKQQQQQQQHHALRGNRSEQMLPLRQMFQWAHVAYSGTVAHERAANHIPHAMAPSFAKPARLNSRSGGAMEGRHHHAGICNTRRPDKQENNERERYKYFPNLHKVIITPYATISISSPSMSVIFTATLLPARGSSSS